MTSAATPPLPQHPPPVEASEPSEAPPPRKRRRRTTAGGATDDCFACRNRAVQCDRKRPYCTQCIEIGRECSGYKTTLTWGVGVASRGKLRGLTCPVANKNADGSDMSPSEMEVRRRKSSATKSIKKEEPAETSPVSPVAAMSQIPAAPPSHINNHAQLYQQPQLPMAMPMAQPGWRIPGFNDHLQARHVPQPQLQPLQTALGPHFDGINVPTSGRSVTSYAETEYHSPMEFPHTPGSLHFAEQPQPPPPVVMPFSDQLPSTTTESFGIHGATMDAFPDGMGSSGMNPAPTRTSYPDHELLSAGHGEGAATFNDAIFPSEDPIFGAINDGRLSFDPFNTSAIQLEDDGGEEGTKDLALLDTRFSSPFYHLTPRLQSLLDYYDRNICPYLVAFDGPDNPYRKHILQLAVGSEGLQNAIAALSTNNLRMRRKGPAQLGFVEEITEGFSGSSLDANEATPEETCYKQMSIDQLNMQLLDKRAAQDDSVLATLLILCLFHVSDSGFSKFKTQLAGVQKLLSLRNPQLQSELTGWVEMFFTWFDVMTSAVNDREMQIKGDSLAMLDYSANLGALEQFSGCDGRLFKLIARLGRLNLLSQGRPVRRQSGFASPRPKPLPRPFARPSRRKKASNRFRSLSAADYENIDGNGWGTPIISSDEDADGSADEEFAQPDDRHEFWKEWHDIRSRLQSWQVDASKLPSPSNAGAAEMDVSGQRDLEHINESFRYAALLYTERLGHPVLPSSHMQFQHLVAAGLAHIRALPVDSCVTKFLLWPLFIIGTECVQEEDRALCRERCRAIQAESGFYNNLSSLEVLEKVWREAGSNVPGNEAEEVRARRRDSEVRPAGRHGQAFRWRKAMDRQSGEYIVL